MDTTSLLATEREKIVSRAVTDEAKESRLTIAGNEKWQQSGAKRSLPAGGAFQVMDVSLWPVKYDRRACANTVEGPQVSSLPSASTAAMMYSS